MDDVEQLKQDNKQLKQDNKQQKQDNAQLRKEFDQSIVDRDSNVAIHELSNYIFVCRRFIANKAGCSTWQEFKRVKTNRQCDRITASAFKNWGFEIMDHWSTIQNVSSTLNNCKHKPIKIGDGKRLLDIISMSTQHKEYHSAFCQLVLLVESRLLAEEVH